jgi:hypothetical protein
VQDGRIRVHRVICAVDCGTVVNPAGVTAQMEGGVVFGLSAALHGEITLREGRVQQSNFHDYPPLRLAEAPHVDVHIVPSTEPATGVGEPGVPPIAPAVANAVFAATGKRLRRLPLRLAVALLAVLGARSAAAQSARPSSAEGLAAFETVRQVLQHPRCQNCHIPGDAPLQFDEGRLHGQNVVRGRFGLGVPGLPCASCHARENPPANYGPSMPPGAPNWHLPRPETKMVFIGLSPAQLCATIKNRKATGGRDLAAMLEHNANDALVGWGWDPGVGRAPVPIPRAEFLERFRTWMDAGAPCPSK